MASDPMDLLQGTLDVLILRSLADRPRHGYDVSRWVRERTDGTERADGQEDRVDRGIGNHCCEAV